MILSGISKRFYIKVTSLVEGERLYGGGNSPVGFLRVQMGRYPHMYGDVLHTTIGAQWCVGRNV